jgi:dihydroorotase
MPNLKPPVTTVALAQAYRSRIEQAMAEVGVSKEHFTPLMTLYLTDNTTPDEIVRAKETGAALAVKLYPAGATTNSDAGVTDLLGRCMPALEAMQRVGMPLLVHGEVTDPFVDVFDREALFIDRVMIPLRKALPALPVVLSISPPRMVRSTCAMQRDPWLRRSLRNICCTTVMQFFRVGCDRIFTACLF